MLTARNSSIAVKMDFLPVLIAAKFTCAPSAPFAQVVTYSSGSTSYLIRMGLETLFSVISVKRKSIARLPCRVSTGVTSVIMMYVSIASKLRRAPEHLTNTINFRIYTLKLFGYSKYFKPIVILFNLVQAILVVI